MSEPLYFNDTQSFLQYNKDIISNNYFTFYPAIAGMQSPEVKEVYQLYNVMEEDGSNAYCLWYSGCYVIHSLKWSERVVDILSEIVEFDKFTNYSFIGQKQLLSTLLKKNNVKYEVFKDRIVYECNQTAELGELKGALEKATMEDFKELSLMSYNYHLEEYGKHAGRSMEYMSDIVKSGIERGNIFKLSDGNEICSLAQVISQGKYFPIIGQFYTKPVLRKSGYATSLLHKLTSKLFKEGNGKCGLMADTKNIPSNIVFNKVGYQPIYEQLSVFV